MSFSALKQEFKVVLINKMAHTNQLWGEWGRHELVNGFVLWKAFSCIILISKCFSMIPFIEVNVLK